MGFSALTRALACLCAALLLCLRTSAAEQAAAPRIEARSANFLLVGVVHGDLLRIHLSRLLDNAPVRDAVVTVLLKGTAHSTTAEADGSYSLRAPELGVPGAAAIEFDVMQGTAHESIKGALEISSAPGKAPDRSSARQLWWWALNFAVCIGFLLLLSRRRKTAKA
jgi:hypothetical protein